MERELAYGNHRSATKYRGEALRNTATNMDLAKAIVLPKAQAKEISGFRWLNRRISCELRVIHDLTFGWGDDTEEGRA